MKIAYRLMVMVVMVALVMGCRDRAAEKRIAELESRLAQIENKSTAPTAVAATKATPAVPEVKPEGPLPVVEFERVDQ